MACGRRLEKIKSWAKVLKKEIRALYLAYHHPATPFYAKLWVFFVVAYAVSPIDLIPDFIPIVGYLDDLVLLPIGIWLAIKMIPPEVLAECRTKADQPIRFSGAMKWAAVMIIAMLWIAVILFIGVLIRRRWFDS